jgi:hypothetical protein
VDVIRLGVEDDERRHRPHQRHLLRRLLPISPGRDARTGGFIEFDAAVRDEPLVMRATYWGGERDRQFHIEVDGRRIASERLAGEPAGEFIERDYDIPVDLLKGRERIRIRIQPEPGYTAGPLFGCRILAADSSG